MERDEKTFTDDMIMGAGQTDEQRGRAFLERLRRRAADESWDKAYDALDYVMGPGRPLRELPVDLAAALGRVLREST